MKISLGDLVDRLSIVNLKIWHLESDVRQRKLDSDIKEVGRRAIAIRDQNAERIALKNAINEYASCGFKEIKVDHVSE